MSYASHLFITYSLYPNDRNITISIGTLVKLIELGTIHLSLDITLKNVLHVPYVDQ